MEIDVPKLSTPPPPKNIDVARGPLRVNERQSTVGKRKQHQTQAGKPKAKTTPEATSEVEANQNRHRGVHMWKLALLPRKHTRHSVIGVTRLWEPLVHGDGGHDHREATARASPSPAMCYGNADKHKATQHPTEKQNPPKARCTIGLGC